MIHGIDLSFPAELDVSGQIKGLHSITAALPQPSAGREIYRNQALIRRLQFFLCAAGAETNPQRQQKENAQNSFHSVSSV
jgi:hypothetical protein